jgi:2-methylfumaryl-CoA isomerase
MAGAVERHRHARGNRGAGGRLGESLADEGARFRHRAAITALLAPWFAARKVPEFAKMFDEAGVTWSIFRDFATALAEDPDLSLQNPMFSRVEQPGIGAYRVPGTPMSLHR